MNSISWYEALQASLASCLPCLSRTDSTGSDAENPPRHLRPLLASNDSSNTNFGDNLSLHSAFGDDSRHRRNRKKASPSKSIRIFGIDLFGKRPPPIHLPDGDGDDDALLRSHGRRQRQSSSSSSSEPYTFDSDAAPLDSAAINQFTAEDIAARVSAAAEEERLAKEERTKRRRERKALKRLADSFALGDGDFEGFPGSGAGAGGGGGGDPYKAIPSPLLRLAQGDDASSSDGSQGSRPHVRRPQPPPNPEEEEEEEADFDGMTYARPKRSSDSANGSRSGGRSNSDSRTTSSVPPPPPAANAETRKVKKSKSKSSKSSSNTRSSASGSTQSPSSVGSPVATYFNAVPRPKVDSSFEGVDFDTPDSPDHAVRIATEFPSAGLGARRSSGTLSGAFLATRGED